MVGSLVDGLSRLRYTDVDYLVFSSAAENVYAGVSPYSIPEYRYSPLLAWLLLPNVLLPSFGKILFSLADAATGPLLQTMLLQMRLPRRHCQRVAMVWALNPVTLVIATRGSADALSNLLFLLVLHLHSLGKHVSAGGCFGLLVHLRLIHIVYTPALLLSIFRGDLSRSLKDHESTFPCSRPSLTSMQWRQVLYFGVPALVTYLSLLVFAHSLYGKEYLNNAILYHLTRCFSPFRYSYNLFRTDFRHNFSPFFLPIYLAGGTPGVLLRYACFVPQLLLLLVSTFTLAQRDTLFICVFIQTMTFVTYNKVS